MNRLALPVLAFALVSGVPALADGASATAPPGGVVRWPGEGIERCGRGDVGWEPIGDACWFALDLLESASQVTVWRRVGGSRQTAIVGLADYPYPVQYITLEDNSKVNLSEEDGARAARESSQIGALWGLDGPRRFTLPLGAPLAELPEGGRFGSRRFFNNQPRSPHSGSDFAAGTGTPVLAVGEGTVVLAGDFFFSGKSVFLHHGDGLISMYFHLSELAVEQEAVVSRGQTIGEVGATGRATGPHLHFGIRWRGARVDPALLLGGVEKVPSVP